FDPEGKAVLPDDGFGDGTDDSIYAGLAVRGRIRAVLLRGRLIVTDGVLGDDTGRGRYLPAAGAAG
ncbi:MAG TPA: dihydropyrimidinase, partial [Streptosporangiaceae bacterium]|nr:dihydropyrimidinase [Streptosporangiaceae bacterium]